MHLSDLSGALSSETLYRVTIPSGAAAFAVSTSAEPATWICF